jgi:hypothetical protein
VYLDFAVTAMLTATFTFIFTINLMPCGVMINSSTHAVFYVHINSDLESLLDLNGS